MNTQFQARTQSFTGRIVNNDPLRSRIYLSEKPLRSSDFSKQGQRRAVEEIMAEIIRIPPNLIVPFAMHLNTYEADFRLTFQQKPECMEDVVRVDVLLFTNKGWFELDERTISEKLRVNLAVFAWPTIGEHFDKGTSLMMTGTRSCIICENVQHGKILGYNNMGPIKPIYSWPKCCTNPDCLSHTLDEAVDPSYVAPRDELREAANKNLEDEGSLASMIRKVLSGSDEMRQDIANEGRNDTEG